MATSSAMSTDNQYIKYTISITQNSQSVTNNTSNVTVQVRFYRTNTGYTSYGYGTVYCKINGTTYSASVTSSQKITSSGIILFTKTLNISHNTNGTKTLTCSAWISHDVVTSSEQSYSLGLTTIPRKSSLSASNGTLGTAQTLTVTRQSTSFTHTITYTCGSASGTVCTKSSSTSISFTPPYNLAQQNLSGTSVSIKFTITTYNGSTSLGSNTKTISCTMPALIRPSCTVTVTDPTGYADYFGSFIQGISKFKVVVNSTLAYGSAISAYKTTANGVTYTTASFTTDALKYSGTMTISARVTDRRGRSGSVTSQQTVTAYSPPEITQLEVRRCTSGGVYDDQGGYAIVTVGAAITALNNKNTATYTLEYKKTSESTYTTVSLATLDNAYSFSDHAVTMLTLATDSSYDIRLKAKDNFNTTYRSTSVSTAFTLMDFRADGTGMGIGKIGEEPNILDIGLQTRLAGGLLPPVLEAETDLDDVRTPNTYVGANTLHYNYANCPLTSGTFALDVISGGDAGQVQQRLIQCVKTNPRIWERWYYTGTWGAWSEITPYEFSLYHVSGGSAGTITLTETSDNFRYLEIFFTDNNGYTKGYFKHYVPSGTLVDLHTIEANSSASTIIRRSRYSISGTTITPETSLSGYVQIYNNGNSPSYSMGTNYLKIYRVVGIRQG